MNSSYRSEKSYNGYTMDVLKSGLAKYTRRSEFAKLAYVCIELDLFAYDTPETGGRGETLRTNFIHRLMIAYLEEIATADIGLWIKINELTRVLLEERKKRKGLDCKDKKFRKIRKIEEKAVIDYVYLLANSEHGREMSHYRAVYGFANSPEKNEFAKIYYPEIYKMYMNLRFAEMNETASSQYKLIKKSGGEPQLKFSFSKEELEVKFEANNLLKNLEGEDDTKEYAIYWAFEIMRKLKKGGRHYRKTKPVYFIFALMEAYIKELDIKKEVKAVLLKVQEIGRDWYTELTNLKENFMCWLLPLLTLVRPVQDIKIKKAVQADPEEAQDLYAINLSEDKLDLDDYIFDMHTRAGKKVGMGAFDFATEGSIVVNESPVVNKLYKKFYSEFKVFSALGKEEYDYYRLENIEKVNKESKVFKVRCRAQLTCSHVRSDTYFAYDLRDNKKVFVKGPYITESEAKIPYKIAELKSYFKYILPLKVKLEMFQPDLFPDVPMGIRKKTDRKDFYPFLVFEDLTASEELKTMKRTSKLWPETEVVDWSKMKTCCVPNVFNLRKDDPPAFEMYIYNIIFRWIVGIGDHADRNFIYNPEKHTIISVDDERLGGETNMYKALKKKKAAFIKDYIDLHYPCIEKIMKEWKESWKKNENKLARLLQDESVASFIKKRLKVVQNKKSLMRVFDEN